MSERDLSAVLRSPLDEPEPQPQWWPLVAGILAGGLVVVGGYLVAGGGAEVAPPATAMAPTTSTSAVSAGGDDDQPAFPSSYVELTDVVAAKPSHAIDLGEQVAIVFTTVTHRGVETEGFFGGRWVLETADRAVDSTGVVTDPFAGGNFSVLFPAAGDAPMESLRLVELWQRSDRFGSVTIDPVTLPGVIAATTVDLLPGVTIELDAIELGESAATVSWRLTSGEAVDVSVFIRAVDGDRDVAVFFSGGGGFFGAESVEPMAGGTVTLQRDQSSEEAIDAATAVVIDVNVSLVVSLPAQAVFDVTELPFATP